MPTATTIIQTALNLTTATTNAVGRGAGPAQLAAGLAAMNRMTESWGLDRYLIHRILRTQFPLTSSVGTYTVGTGGTVNIDVPEKIENAGYVDASGLERNVQILTKDQYAGVYNKSALTQSPQSLYYDRAFPLANIILVPIPSGANDLVIYTPEGIAQFPDLTTNVALPRGYEHALTYNLAIYLAPQIKANVSPLVIQQAREALSAIRSTNARITTRLTDAAMMPRQRAGRFDTRGNR